MLIVNDTVQLKERYGSLPTHHEYLVLDEGKDWVRIRHGGQAVYVPKYFLGKAPEQRQYDEEKNDGFEM